MPVQRDRPYAAMNFHVDLGLGDGPDAGVSEVVFPEARLLVNEYRIDMSSKQGTTFLLEQAEKFFFGDGVAKPEGYVPPSEEKKP